MACGDPIIQSEYFLKGLADVNADGISQGRILVVDQNCIHTYVDPCTILNQCQALFNTFLSLTDTPDSYSGESLKIVRVNGGGTGLEFVTASSIFSSLGRTDQYVKTNSSDPIAGYLFDKISVGQGIQKSVVGNTVQLSINTSTMPQIIGTFLQLTDTPSSYSGKAGYAVIVKQNESGLEFKTGNFINPPWGRRYLTADVTFGAADLPGNNLYVFLVPGFTGFKGNSSYIQATGVTHTAGGKTTNILRIPETGVYKVVIKGTVRLNAVIHAFRIFLASTHGTSILAACDCKRGDQHFNSGDYTDQYKYFDFGKEMLLRLEKDTYIFSGVVIDTLFPAGRGPTPAPAIREAVILHQNVVEGGIEDKGTSFEISRFSSDEGYIDA